MTYFKEQQLKRQRYKYIQKTLKESYRDDYFNTLRNLPRYQRAYFKVRYVIVTHGKH